MLQWNPLDNIILPNPLDILGGVLLFYIENEWCSENSNDLSEVRVNKVK